jgi:hypothetical protein
MFVCFLQQPNHTHASLVAHRTFPQGYPCEFFLKVAVIAWATRVIEAVRNYGEMFKRDLGSGSVMKLARGASNLWAQGGLMCASPIR